MTQVIQTLEAPQLAEARPYATVITARINSSSSASLTEQYCQWRVHDLNDVQICGARITHHDVPKHFRIHGIKKMHDKKVIGCLWSGCNEQVGRKNFVRHVRECHLNRRRQTKHSSRNQARSVSCC